MPTALVIGGGTVGLAAARSLSRRGHAVTVLERFEHVHERGSHGGFTRIIRQAYHEGTGYVELVRAAEDEWLALQAGLDETLLVRTGLLEFGPPDDLELRAAIAACRSCGVEHEMVRPAKARERWPFAIPDHHEVCFTPSGGYLRVQACLDALREAARGDGTSFRYGARVVEIDPVQTTARLADGTSLSADSLVVAAGAYTHALVPGFAGAGLYALRRALVWMRPDEAHRAVLSAMPVWGAFVPEGFFYGFPWNREGIDGFKLACHTSSALPGLDDEVDPETVDRSLREADRGPVADFLGRYLPRAGDEIITHKICMYGATPSWNFLIDHHADSPRTVVAAGFSGHGFKFAPVLGELVADLVEQRDSPWQRSAFLRSAHVTGASSS